MGLSSVNRENLQNSLIEIDRYAPGMLLVYMSVMIFSLSLSLDKIHHHHPVVGTMAPSSGCRKLQNFLVRNLLCNFHSFCTSLSGTDRVTVTGHFRSCVVSVYMCEREREREDGEEY